MVIKRIKSEKYTCIQSKQQKWTNYKSRYDNTLPEGAQLSDSVTTQV